MWENVTENYKFSRFCIPGGALIKIIVSVLLCRYNKFDHWTSLVNLMLENFYEKFVKLCQFYLDTGQM